MKPFCLGLIMITREEIQNVLDYDEISGIFTWKYAARPNLSVGSIAGYVNKNGYRVIMIKHKSYMAHRLAWLYKFGIFPKLFIDHIDGDRLNNAISNLRDIDNKMNRQNQRKPMSNNRSGFLGVVFIKKINKFRANIQHNGIQYSLGCFSTAEDAHNAYLIAKRELHIGCTI